MFRNHLNVVNNLKTHIRVSDEENMERTLEEKFSESFTCFPAFQHSNISVLKKCCNITTLQHYNIPM